MAVTAQIATHPARSESAYRSARFAFLILLLLAATFTYLHFFDQQHPLAHNDLHGRQFATQAMLERGADPYSPEMRHEIQNVTGHDQGQGFDYPVLLGVLLVPVANMPWAALRVAFLLLMILALFGSFLICIRLADLRMTRARAGSLALLALCSWPTVFALRLQQPTLLVAAFVLPACFLLSRGRDRSAGILLALSTFKPQLVLPLLLWLLLWTCVRRRWTLLLAFTITEVIYFLCAERLDAGWLRRWLSDLGRYHNLARNLPLQLMLGHWVGTLGTIALIGWAVRHLWQVRQCSAQSDAFARAMGLLLTLGVCLTPATWGMVYDQVLLVPAIFLLLAQRRAEGAGLTLVVNRSAWLLVLWPLAAIPVAAVGMIFLPSMVWMGLPFLNHLVAPMLTVALLLRS